MCVTQPEWVNNSFWRRVLHVHTYYAELLQWHRYHSMIDPVPRKKKQYNDVIMGVIVSQITSLTIVYSTVYSGADHRKHQSSASLAFLRGIHRGPVNSPHKWPVTRKMLLFDNVIMVVNGTTAKHNNAWAWQFLLLIWIHRQISMYVISLQWYQLIWFIINNN